MTDQEHADKLAKEEPPVPEDATVHGTEPSVDPDNQQTRLTFQDKRLAQAAADQGDTTGEHIWLGDNQDVGDTTFRRKVRTVIKRQQERQRKPDA
jgi:hypothetical protein